MQSFAPLGSPSIPADWVSTADQQLPDVTTLYVTPESLSSVVVTVAGISCGDMADSVAAGLQTPLHFVDHSSGQRSPWPLNSVTL